MSALALRPRQLPRRLFAALVALAYALPLAVGAASDLSHGAFHALGGLQERKAEAAALGLVHLAERSTFTHTHDGVTHAHAGAVDALLVAAEQADESTDAQAPMVKLSVHTPATVVEVLVGLAIARTAAMMDAIAPSHPRALPPVPPPRG
ncbi:MAG: hypothetical protein ABL963_08815 [Longimicrobiales bacterium]